ncbi:hypothetical protein BSKO_02317 [Bryopsis sp. KO-2023]|nr:hypothetical protein BSKO_02317 [Bryopsis sp. KO-2023]
MSEVTEAEPSKLETIKNYFRERGLTAKDIPTAFVVHEIMSVTFALSTWVGCYYLQPGKSVARPLRQMLGKSKSKAVQKTYLSSVSRAKKIVAKVPLVDKGNATRLTTSCAESAIFRLAVKPITVPGKLWATWRIITAWKYPSTQIIKP